MFKDLKHHYPATILMFVILIWGSYYLFNQSMSEYPSYVHAWTQSDRLALAMNFQENGFDFFHPATYNLLTKDGITQVDFPIHDYLVAVISKVLNSDLVFTFRLYNLLYALIGLFFFFRLALLLTKSDRRAIWATSFLFTLPVLVYYQNGFLPSVPSFANFIIGLYAFALYLNNFKLKHFYLSIGFLTLAALSRSPFFVFLFALLLHRIVISFQSKKWRIKELFASLLGIALFIAYFAYNQSLANKYGSMFLTELLYFDSIDAFTNVINTAVDRFGKEILSPFHAILLIALLAVAYVQLKKGLKVTFWWSSMSLYFLISLIGVALFFYLMGKQFADHDYYYIDTFYPLLAMILLLCLSKIEIPKKWYTPTAVVSGIFFFYFFSHAKDIQEKRYTPPYNDRIDYAYEVYKRAKSDLKDWGIDKKDTLLVLDAVSTNMPFTLWQNRGYTLLNSGEETVKNALDTLDFSYVVLLDSNFVTDTYKDYPELIKRLKLVHHNGELGLYKKSQENNPVHFFEHFHYLAEDDFDGQSTLDSATLAWAKIEETDSIYGKSYYLPFDYEYALTVKKQFNNLNSNIPLEVFVLADYKPLGDTAQIQLVLSHGDFYEAQYLENFITKVDEWQQKLFRFKVPAAKLNLNEPISIYFWNPEKDNLYIDNYKILIYQ
ncbi:MAG: hypothetical protein CMC96_14945 [Flavobacteriales bacterium]|nr:hypothetical protein [Flavobacteriales bacterium]|tara:strand:+ start:12475 stop:14460 length:1986 start_codon:yes stop_codon:yes gene_type:complete